MLVFIDTSESLLLFFLLAFSSFASERLSITSLYNSYQLIAKYNNVFKVIPSQKKEYLRFLRLGYAVNIRTLQKKEGITVLFFAQYRWPL